MVRALFLSLVVLLTAGPSMAEEKPRPIVVFAGSAIQLPLEEAARSFEKKTGNAVVLHLGGSGKMLSQIHLTGKGDLFIPASPDYLELARERNLVKGDAKVLAYLVPAILVAKGNPLGIRGLEDLSRPGLRVGFADPKGVVVGLYWIEILVANGLENAVRPNLRGQVESGARVASMIPLGMADVVLGWREFAAWNPAVMEAVIPRPGQLPRLAFVSAVKVRGTANSHGAEAFLTFLASSEGEKIFRSHGYLVRESEVRPMAPNARIGGVYQLPEGWR